jgi:hypothetical protein
LWHFQTPDGRSILKAVEFMAPYADPKRAWPYQQIHKANRGDLEEILQRAAAEYPDNKTVKDALRHFDGKPDNLIRLYSRVQPG